MKKLFLSIFALFIVISPILVKADAIPVVIDSYSVQTTVGSEIVIKLTGVKFNNDILAYNQDELEYVSVNVTDIDVLPDIYPELGTVKINSNENGKLNFTFEAKEVPDAYKNLVFKFKVKAAPADSKIKITYIPTDKSSLYGEESAEVEYTVITNKDCDSKNNEVKEQTEKCCNNDLLLYTSWGASAALLIVVIILLATKGKSKKVTE